MSRKSWAEREIELACKYENPNWDGKSFDYGCACYQSALKAYKILTKDGHSGMSFRITKNILIRLMNNLPLRPITDEDFVSPCSPNPEDKSSIQCSRMSSLYRNEAPNGKVTYTDVNRCYGIDIHNPNITYVSGEISKIINSLFPITMPYYPTVEKYKVYSEDFLTDRANGDYDTKGYFYCITPIGEKVEINRFFAEKSNHWVEISKEEYNQRKSIKLYPFKDEYNPK